MLIFNTKLYIIYFIFTYILIQDISWYNIYQVTGGSVRVKVYSMSLLFPLSLTQDIALQ